MDYDNIRAGIDDNIYKFDSPEAKDSEGDKIIMKFMGLEVIPCKCIKIIQDGSIFRFIAYTDLISQLDQNTWNITI